MKVSIKSFDVGMEVKKKGIELEIRKPDGKHLGDLVVTNTRMIWCKGRRKPRYGKKVNWTDVIRLLETNQPKPPRRRRRKPAARAA